MKQKYLLLFIITTTLFASCSFIEGAIASAPTEIYSKNELLENIQKLKESSDYKSEDDMLFWDIYVRFSYSFIESNCTMWADYNIVDPEDKNKLVFESFQSQYNSFTMTENVKIVDGDDNEVKDFNLFKHHLFKISDLKQIENFDALMQKALDSVEEKNEDNYISIFKITSVPEIIYSFEIKNKKSPVYDERIKFKDNGEIVK